MRLLALLALLLPAPVATAQASLYNLTIPAGVQCTVIDWQGNPSLCLVRWGPGYMFKLPGPAWSPPPHVELTVAGVGVWDFRPCAQGGTYWLQPDYENQFLYCLLPPSGLHMTTTWVNPIKIDGRTMQNFNYGFYSVRSNSITTIRTTTCQDEFPEGACLVLGLAIR